MSGSKIFADTNICIYLLDGNQDIAKLLHGYEVFISVITEIELYSFKDEKSYDVKIIDEFVNAVNIVELNTAIKEKTIEIRRAKKLKVPDAIIAATVKTLQIPFVTADKGFRRVEGINIILYEPTIS